LGYSKKGYTDGEIGRAWIETFDKETRAKAKGRRRLLLVDGHNSHYTPGFLEYARAHRIEVVGYPSHSTHVYQGLDVVIFASMKKRWSEARDDWERRGHVVDKTNFLAVYAEAHAKTLTPENIKAAFRKTGVIPFNPDVVTTDMMAPSQETSTRAAVPIQQSGPIKTMSEMIIDYLDYQRITTSDNNSMDAKDLLGLSPTPVVTVTPLRLIVPICARVPVPLPYVYHRLGYQPYRTFLGLSRDLDR
jgi:DDE superfamily endonuclease